MFKLDENYYLRKCFFAREQVPTQSVMRGKMGAPLAAVYFQSMNHNLKVLVGLEPPLRGGGSDWFVPPMELLKERCVLKPCRKAHLSMLGFNGIDALGERLIAAHRQRLEEEKNAALLASDTSWKKTIVLDCRTTWDEIAQAAADDNTAKIREACHQFRLLYASALNSLEDIMKDATVQQIERTRQEAHKYMSNKFQKLLQSQATMLYDRYTKRFYDEKEGRKNTFLREIEEARTKLGNTVHDINVDKHVAIEKLRNLLECQNLACQVYVALKEREECEKQMDEAKREHKKKVKSLNEQIDMRNFEIKLELEKEKNKREFVQIWQKKVYHIVRRFQMFVSYCLKFLPEQAEFFLNMEKLMMMQLNEAADNPSAESIIEPEPEEFRAPVPRNKPFVVVGDVGYKPQFDEALCPKKVKSTPSHLPVMVINKRCIYSACDNIERFTDLMKEFLHGRRGEDFDVADDHDYQFDIPVTHTKSQQLLELKLEDSIMQVLQSEIPNTKDVPTLCCLCKLSHCFCSPLQASKMIFTPPKTPQKEPSEVSISSGTKVDTRSVELIHEREPKWESYMSFVKTKRCKCAKTAKKHLEEHLPPYMRLVSKYEAPELPNYEPCDIHTLKRLVKRYQAKKPKVEPPKVESKTRDIGAQYSDQDYDFLCTCFSDDELTKLYRDLVKENTSFGWTETKLDLVQGPSPSRLDQPPSSFATERAYSLRRILNKSPELEELFAKAHCDSVSAGPSGKLLP